MKRRTELLAETNRQLGRPDNRFRIVPVHVENWRLDHLGDVRRYGVNRPCLGAVVNPI